MSIRVLIADDHPTFVRAVTFLLNDDPEIDVVAVAHDGTEAVELAMQQQPDVVLMDVDMPRTNGIDATRQIVDAAPHIAVVVLTMFDDDDKVAEAVRQGAVGYLLKGARQEQIRRAVRAAYAGEAIFDAPIARRLKRVFAEPQPAPDREEFAELTDRERDVLDRMAAGLDNSAIANALYLSEKTVRNYVSSIFAKLHVGNRPEAIVRARDAGFGKA